MRQLMEIICVGNELLIGKTLNTNATWLAKRTTSLGFKVGRVTVVGDDVGEIGKALCEALRRKPKLILTTGGLGPTFDDKTLEGIAKGLHLKLGVNPEALKMLTEKYRAYLQQREIKKVELTPARLKMATLPKGAKPLPNPVGTAPAVMVKANETYIVALPGVPPEMQAIFNESLASLIKKEAGKTAFYERSIYADCIMESTLAPLIDQVMHDNPYVYIKSHVYTKSRLRVEGKKSHIELHFSTSGEEPEAAKSRLKEAVVRMSELVEKNGGQTRELNKSSG